VSQGFCNDDCNDDDGVVETTAASGDLHAIFGSTESTLAAGFEFGDFCAVVLGFGAFSRAGEVESVSSVFIGVYWRFRSPLSCEKIDVAPAKIEVGVALV
jgi:hypothetical protein